MQGQTIRKKVIENGRAKYNKKNIFGGYAKYG